MTTNINLEGPELSPGGVNFRVELSKKLSATASTPHTREPKTREGQATPTRWRVNYGQDKFTDSVTVETCVSLPHHTPVIIATCGAVDNPIAEANAELVVSAVNSHQALLDAARAALPVVDDVYQDALHEGPAMVGVAESFRLQAEVLRAAIRLATTNSD